MPKKTPLIRSELGERFRKFRTDLRLNQSNMANLLGISQSTLSLVERGEAPLPFDAICSLADKFPSLDLRRLLLGTAAGLDLKASDVNVHAAPLLKLITPPSDDPPGEQQACDAFAVPLLESKVAAGSGSFTWSQVLGLVWVHGQEMEPRRNLIAVRAGDEAMRPTIPGGAIVVIDLDHREPSHDPHGIWAVRVKQGDDLALTRLQSLPDQPGFLMLRENFSEYPPTMAWSREPDDLVVGKVIWLWRKLD